MDAARRRGGGGRMDGRGRPREYQVRRGRLSATSGQDAVSVTRGDVCAASGVGCTSGTSSVQQKPSLTYPFVSGHIIIVGRQMKHMILQSIFHIFNTLHAKYVNKNDFYL